MQTLILFITLSTVFANPALDDQGIWPDLDSSSDLTGSADLGQMPNDDSAKNPDQSLFLSGPAGIEGYSKLDPQGSVMETSLNDGLLANLGDSAEPYSIFDPFGFDNKAGPPEPTFENKAGPPEPFYIPPVAPLPDFPLPDCGKKYLLCCSGVAFNGGLRGKCNWCMLSNPATLGTWLEEKSSEKWF